MNHENDPRVIAWETTGHELSLIGAVLDFVCNDGRVEPWEFERRLGGSRDALLTLLRRVNERLDAGRYDDFVDVRAPVLWVEGITFDERRGRTVLECHDFSADLEWDPGDRPRELLALRGDDRLALPGVRALGIHRWSKGWAWEVIGSERLPVPPFLLTDEADCRPVFRGDVLLRPAADEAVRAIDAHARLESAVPLVGDRWFGVVHLDPGDRRRGRLAAFGREDVRLTSGEAVVAMPFLDGEFGRIVVL
ncbi:MAG TPA: hypothetical protein VG406_15585 [Isosphaeraceae bacterium]|nr:hypothetical protein [Isosphaeraceae bacterium]